VKILKKIVKAMLPYGFVRFVQFQKTNRKADQKNSHWAVELVNISVEKAEWKNISETDYNKIDFTGVEFYDEQILANIEEHLHGNIEGTNYSKSEMSYKDRAFLNGIIRKTKPKTIVEIGLSAGGSTCVILNAISDVEGSKLYSFDYNTDWYRQKGQKNSRKTGFLVKEIIPKLLSKWELYTGGTACKYFDEVLPENGIDLCLIDTVHSNPGEHLNILEVLPYMKKAGIIIYHDTVYHTFRNNVYGTTCCSSINALNGKRIILKSEKTMGLPNISGIVLDENINEMLWALFSNLSLPWAYKISDEDFIEMFKHFSKYYEKDLIRIFAYYCYFYMNSEFKNKKLIAEKETMNLFGKS